MTNDQILEGIESYCADNESDYAIMITGPWGSGKTYFAHNKIKRLLEERGKKTVYVSLFGITKNEEIDHLVIQAVYPFVKTSIFKLGSAVAQTAIKTAASLHQVDLVLPQLSMPVRDIVIIFDDLERASKSIDTSDLIGYINRYCAQRHVKCIIVSNEEEIDKSEDSDEIAYRTAKEKTVRYTYKYEFDLDQLLVYLSDVSRDEVEKTASHVIEAERDALNMLPKGNEASARIVITAYHLVTRLIVKAVHIKYENHYNAFIVNVSRCILAYLIDHKSHQLNIEEIMRTIERQETLAFDLISVRHIMSGSVEEDAWREDVHDIRNIYSRIRKNFFSFRQLFYLSKVAALLVYHGAVSEKNVNDEFQDFVDKIFPKQDKLNLLFSDYSLLDDNSFSSALKESIRRLNNDEMTLSNIIHMVYFLEFFVNEGLINGYNYDALLQQSTAAVDRLFEGSFNLVEPDELSRISFQYPNLDGIAKKVSEYAKEKLPKVREDWLKGKAINDWREIYADPTPNTLYQKFAHQSEWNRDVFFGYLEADEILLGIKTMSNAVKKALASMILTRYTESPYQNIGDVFDKEKGKLYAIRRSLKDEVERCPVPIPLSIYLKNNIVTVIDKAFDRFTPPTPEPAQSPD